MAAKKTPTNADLASDIKELSKLVTPLVQDVNMLKNWKIAEDAAKTAVAQYRREEMTTAGSRRWAQVAKDLLPLIVALTVLAYALANHLGAR